MEPGYLSLAVDILTRLIIGPAFITLFKLELKFCLHEALRDSIDARLGEIQVGFQCGKGCVDDCWLEKGT